MNFIARRLLKNSVNLRNRLLCLILRILKYIIVSTGGDSMEGERLSELRKDNGLTQRDLAEILGVSENSISLYERNINTPDDELKIKIANYFNVSLDYLLGATDKQIPLNRNETQFIYAENLPSNAYKEMKTFLDYLQNKYKI